MILPGEKPSALAKYAKKIFLATKPAPVLESKFKGIHFYPDIILLEEKYF